MGVCHGGSVCPGGCLPGRVSAKGGCLPRGMSASGPVGCLPGGGGDVCLWSGGQCLCRGVSAQVGVW